MGLQVSSNEKIKVYYKGENVGDYYADNSKQYNYSRVKSSRIYC